MKRSPFKKRYAELVKASTATPSSENRANTAKAFGERNQALHQVAKLILYYGFTSRELRMATEAVKIDAEFERKYGQSNSQVPNESDSGSGHDS